MERRCLVTRAHVGRRHLGRAVLAALVMFPAACGRFDFDPEHRDRDRDGVVDWIDNCPDVANPDQHDEDDDRIGDACDLCPHLHSRASGVNDGDQDGDGVGDDCDPDPDLCDQIVAFLTFHEPPRDWSVLPPAPDRAWDVTGDDGLFTLSGSAVGMLTMPSPDRTTVQMEVGVTVDEVSSDLGQGVIRNVGIVDDYAPGTDSGLLFGVVVDDLMQARDANLEIDGVQNGVPAGSYAGPLRVSDELPGSYRIRYTRRNSARTIELPGAVPAPRETYSQARGSDGKIGVRARGTTDRLHYVIVIASCVSR